MTRLSLHRPRCYNPPDMRQVRLTAVRFAAVEVTEHTSWAFAEVSDADGVRALVELMGGAAAGKVASLLVEMVVALSGTDIEDEARLEAALGTDPEVLRSDRTLATAVSALRTAVLELQCRHEGVSLTEGLGGAPAASVPLYANINRTLLGRRTPRDFEAAARRAMEEGFTTVKCAPFDEVGPLAAGGEAVRLAAPGLARVAAVRRAVGPGVRLLVDCHSRFEAESAPEVASRLEEHDVGWFEEPVEPIEDIDALSHIAGQFAMPVAGGETGYGRGFFAELVARRAVDVIMPDVVYCGGATEAHRAGRAAIESGCQVSLHSPSGPISQLASAHVTAALPGALALECAVHETPWRAELLDPPERIEGGRLWLPDGAGLGATLNEAVVARHGRRWAA